MTSSKFKQLNPFELKSALTELLGKINSVNDIQNCLADFEMFDGQNDKTLLSKLLLKELINEVIKSMINSIEPMDYLPTKHVNI